MQQQQFKQIVVDLADEYMSHKRIRELEVTDFAAWLLIKQGYERGQQVGYREGIRAASSLVSQMIPDAPATAQELIEDNETTIMLDIPRN